MYSTVSRFFALLFVAAFWLIACQPIEPPPVAPKTDAAPPTALEAKIQNAMSAAPPVIAADATIVDWPSAPGGEQAILRQGSGE